MSELFKRIEPEARSFLKKILKTMFYSISWMFANVVFGLAFEYAYIEGKPTAANIIYYICSVVVLILLVVWLVRTWGQNKNG
jgi:hypothetical protein